VEGILEQVPIDALVVIPFFPLADFASHEQQLFAGVLSYFTDYVFPFQLPNSWGEPWSAYRES
jgi:hypothetical protein